MADQGKSRRILIALGVVAAIVAGWTASLRENVWICETGTNGIRIQLHRTTLLGRQRAVVLMDVESESDLLPGVPPRYEIDSKEEAEMFGMALATPGSPQIAIFSASFREQYCTIQ